MCGIYGFIGKPTNKTTKMIRSLGLLNESRGADSTGLILSDGKTVRGYKRAQPASKFFDNQETIKLLMSCRKNDFVNLIGHTRLASRGMVNDSNAHPFIIKNIVMAHNGSIRNFDELQKTCNTKYEVDSQIIGHLLNTSDPIEVFQDQIQGWFTVPYFNLKNKYQLFLAKHTAPLSLAVLPDGSGLYYSSQKDHLQQALSHAGIKCGVGQTEGSKLYSFEFKDNRLEREHTKLVIKATFGLWDSYNQRNATKSEPLPIYDIDSEQLEPCPGGCNDCTPYKFKSKTQRLKALNARSKELKLVSPKTIETQTRNKPMSINDWDEVLARIRTEKKLFKRVN